MDLSQAVVVVTGAGSGIGRATASAFAARGASLALAGRRTRVLEEAVDEIRARGGKAAAFTCDVREEEQVELLMADVVARFGSLDVLVNNAGVALRKPLRETSGREWRDVIETNLTGPFLCARAAARMMSAGAAIINVSSTLGKRGAPEFAAYSASKAALLSMTQVLAEELRPESIRVYAVCPGSTYTPLHVASVGEEAAREAMRPETVARCIVRVAATELRLPTGAAHVIDESPPPPGVVARALRRLQRLLSPR